MSAPPVVETRSELIYLLTEAAGVEHSLTCQYLFAAFSLKQDVAEGLTLEQMNRVADWERLLLMVARQEMEHLGLVCNLLTAIGGAPALSHPRFPYPTSLYGHRMALERFSEDALKRFVCYERPQEIRPEDAYCLESPLRAAVAGDLSPQPVPYRDIGELYEVIRASLIELEARGAPLFLGGADLQVTGAELGTDFARVGAMGGGYDVFLFTVTDLASALRAVDLITEQGEGTPTHDELSHYRRFLDMLHELQRLQSEHPDFEPARPVVPNPVLYQEEGQLPGTLITHVRTREVLDLCNAAYRTMLLMLVRMFAHTDETPAELDALKAAAFFPFMTMVIRPLSEMLTAMPAFAEEDGPTAGPGFEADQAIQFLPHRQAAWTVLVEQLQELSARCQQLSRTSGMPARLGYIAETLRLITARFQAMTARPR